jgi:hypothetical protein
MIEWNVYSPKVMQANNLNNVVVEVMYSVYARLDDQIVQGDFGSIHLFDPSPNSFLAFEDLSRAVVIQWAKDALGADAVAKMESKLNSLVAERLEKSRVPDATNEPMHFVW